MNTKTGSRSSGLWFRLAAGLFVVALVGAACGDDDDPTSSVLDGASFSLQNFFNAPDDSGTPTLTPFFDQIDATVGEGVEVDIAATNYIYEFAFTGSTIEMGWNPDTSYDQFEPYVGAVGGFTQEQASAAPIADEYHFVFDRDISDVTFTADPSASLVPEVRVEDGNTLVIAVPGGASVGDGISAVISFE